MKGYIFPKYNKNYEEYKKKNSWLNSQGFKKLWNYFLDLIYRESFINDVKILREKYSIPKNGMNLKYYNTIFSGTYDHLELSNNIQDLCTKYHLDPVMWEQSMDNLILFNTTGQPDGVSLCRDYDLEEEKECLDPLNWTGQHTHKILNEAYPVFIKISPYASQRDIVDWIRKNFNTIKKLQDKYKRPEIKIGKSKTKDLQIRKRNTFIYKHRNMHYKDLAVKVGKRFPKAITDSIDEGSVGKIISLETKKRKDM
jgi:hypothetical protein